MFSGRRLERYRQMSMRRADWFIQLNDPVTVKAHCWVHDGVEYLDAAHTMPRDEASR